MATYSTKHDLIPYLDKQFSKTLNDTDVKIRLSNNTPVSICVNRKLIQQISGMWHCDDKVFQYKKSAVAYQICLEYNNQALANQIYLLDHTASKLNEDLSVYRWHMRKAKTKPRRDVLYCRISQDQYRLDHVYNQLTHNLNSIKIA